MFWSESAQAYIERIELPDGSMKQLKSKDKKKLQRKVREFLKREEDGPTFVEAADAWENYQYERVEAKTAESYRPHVKRAKEFFGRKLMKDITPAEVQAYLDSLAELSYARDTVHRALVVVNKIFKFAITQPSSVVRFNPCSSVSVPKGLSKTRREPPTESQIALITPEGMGLFAWFMMYSGLRNSELFALQWSDIDFDAKVIHVTKAAHFDGDTPHLGKTKTEAGVRDVPLLDVLDAVLPRNKKGLVFGKEGRLYTKNEFYRDWTRWCASVGLADEIKEEHIGPNGHKYVKTIWKARVTPYQFRHEFASLLEDANVSEFAAMKAMGHSSISVTKDIYTHIRERKRKNDLAEKMNTMLSLDKVP